jgi:hypothetical protein
MPYNLRTFDGRPFTIVNDGVVDRQGSSSLYFVGKDVKDYGTIQNDNFLWLLENFAGTIEPINKVQGQIWFDKGTLQPKVYDGNEWRTIALTSVGTTTAANISTGELWFDTSKEQLFAKGSSEFVLIGPEKVPGYGKTKFESVKIFDTGNLGHACIVIYSDGDILGAVSNDEFDVKNTEAVYQAGIVRIGRGFNLVSGAEVTQEKIFAQQIEDEIITGNWTFDSNDGMYIKNTQFKVTGTDLKISGIDTFTIETDALIPGKTTTNLGSPSNKFSKIYANEINAGSSITEINLVGQLRVNNSSRIFPGSDASIALGQANARWSTVFTSAINAGASTSQGNIIGNWVLEGNSTIDASLGTLKSKLLTTGSVNDSGTIEGQWQITSGSNLNFAAGAVVFANYADIAEKYKSDKEYEPGTVVEFGGSAEVTACREESSTKVAGVVTTNPAQILNSDLDDSVAIALVGRVPCRVVGDIKKGDLLVSSNVPGAAIANNNPRPGTLIGKAMEDYNSFKVGKIEIMVIRG